MERKKNIIIGIVILVFIIIGYIIFDAISKANYEKNINTYPSKEQMIEDMTDDLKNKLTNYTLNGSKFITNFDKSKIKYNNFKLIEPTSDNDNYVYGNFDIEYEEDKFKFTANLEVQYSFDGKKYNYDMVMFQNEKIIMTDCIDNLKNYENKTALDIIKAKYSDYDSYEIIKSEYNENLNTCMYYVVGTKATTYYTKKDTFNTQFSVATDYFDIKIYSDESFKYDEKVELKLEGKWKSDSHYKLKDFGNIIKNPSLNLEFEKDEYDNFKLKEGYDSLYGCTYDNGYIYPEWSEYHKAYKFSLSGENKGYLVSCGMDFYIKEDSIDFYCDEKNPDGCGHLVKD